MAWKQKLPANDFTGRIYSDRFYVLKSFRASDREYRLVTGLKARSEGKCYVAFEVRGTGSPDVQYALQNGRVPEHQPVVGFESACEWLQANPFQAALLVEVAQ